MKAPRGASSQRWRKSVNRSSTLRSLIADHTVVMPGAFNALTARAIEQAGFEAIYLSGGALANSLVGTPDIGLTTLS